MAGQINFTQVDSPTAPSTGITALSFPATATNQLKWVDADGGTNTIAGGGFTLTVPATGTAVILNGAGGTPSALVLTNATGLPTAGLVDAAVTLAKMADLAQDQFIGRITASTGVPETATITAAARGVLDDATVAAMVDTLGGASASGSGGLVRTTLPTLVTPVLGAATATSINGLGLSGSGFTLTVPATGTAALLGVANVFTAGQIINNGGGNALLLKNTSGSALTSLVFSDLNNSENADIRWLKDNDPFARSAGISSYHAGTWHRKGLDFYTNNSADYSTDATIAMRLTETKRLLLNTTTDSAQLTVQSDAAGTIGLVVNSAASPTANVIELRNNGTNVLALSAPGLLSLTGSTAGFVADRSGSAAFLAIRQDTAGGGRIASIAAGGLAFLDYTGGTEVFRTTVATNVLIGGTAVRSTIVGTKVLSIFDGTAPAGTLTNGCSFYSTAGEMRVMDAAGNATLLSPHDAAGKWVFDSRNTVTGRTLRIDMECMLKKINKHFGWDYVKEIGA